MEHGSTLVPDVTTLLIQAGIFLASWTVLHFLLIRPYLNLLHRRHSATDGLKETAVKANDEAHDLKNKYELHMKSERSRIQNWTETERRKIAESQRELVQKTREKTALSIDNAQAESQRDLKKVREILLPKVPEFAGAIAKKLVGERFSISVDKHPDDADMNTAILS